MTTERARELRRNMTDAERRLWALLRRKKLDGFRFRRQVQIGPYYADFLCPKAKLIVEVDGSFHGDERNALLDETRTFALTQRGCRVIRFWNKDVFIYPDRIVDILYGKLTEAMKAQSPTFNDPPPLSWGKLNGKLRNEPSAPNLKGAGNHDTPLPPRLRRATFPHKGGRRTR